MKTRAGIIVIVVVGMLLSASAALDAKPAERRKGYPSTCKIDAFLEAARSMTPEKRLVEAGRIIAYINSWTQPESDPRETIWSQARATNANGSRTSRGDEGSWGPSPF